MLSFLNRGVDTEVAWQSIERIGEDVILVRLNLEKEKSQTDFI